MTAVWLRARSELRSRMAAILSLAVIVGVIGGVVIAAAAGARRTETAYPRFLAAQNALTLVVQVSSNDPRTARRVQREIDGFPQVEATTTVASAQGAFRIPGRRSRGNVFPIVSPDGRFGTTINRIKILEGRAYDPSAPDEVVPSFSVADSLGLHVGQTIYLVYGGLFSGPPPPGFKPPAPVALHVVGIGAAPSFFAPLSGGYLPAVILSPAFYRVHHAFINDHQQTAAIVLHRGIADEHPFFREVKRLRDHLPPNVQIKLPFNQAGQTGGVQQATRTQAIALWVLAALVGLAGIAIFGQAVARQMFLESIEYPSLRALGVSPSQLFTLGMIRAAAIGLVAAVVAVVVGFLLSPLTPTGIARIAEPSPGFAFDAVVIAIGGVATVLLVTAVAVVPAWNAARTAGNALGTAESKRHRRPSATATAMARASFPPSATAGVRMALEPGRGRTAVPVRTTMFGAALGLVALAAALSFAASLNHLETTPRLSGRDWDTIMFAPGQGPNGVGPAKNLETILDRDRRVSAYSIGNIPNLTVDGVSELTFTMESRKGSVTPSVVEGRLPRTSDEIMLGTATMQMLGVHIGSTVPVVAKGNELRMRVVGRLAVPALFFSFNRGGQGAAVSLSGAKRLGVYDPRQGAAFFVRFAPGVDQQRVIADLERKIGRLFVLPTQQSSQIHNLGGIGDVPLVLAGIVALMAAATLAHTLITSIRRRRLELAILKTLGFVRRQVSATVAWQATALASVAGLVGLPLGVISGRWVWNVFANRLGVVPEVAVPVFAVLLAVPATIVVANLLAVVPGRIASRLKPAPVMRTE